MLADHRDARAAGGDDVLAVGEDVEHAGRQVAGVAEVAVVEERLAAAGLALRKIDRAAVAAEQLDGGDAGVRADGVAEAGDESETLMAGALYPAGEGKLYGPARRRT